MANPQKENGYTAIANEIVEQFCRLNLSPYEWRIVWTILRKTYGWNKKNDFISVSQLEDLTGLDRRNASRAKKSLISRNIITTYGENLGLNKNYEEWISSTQTTQTIVYRDTRPKYFPPLGFPYKKSDQGHCEYCFQIFSYHKQEFHRHHIVPKSKGGKDRNDNLIQVCVPCHLKIHKEMDEWLIVNGDDIGKWYRHFMSLVSSVQTTFLSSVLTSTKEKKTIITKDIISDVPSQDIQEFIYSFKDTNPSYERLFANKTERAASERLLRKYGKEKMLATTLQLPDIVSKPYAPRVTTPYELERNLGKLIIFMEQNKQIIKKQSKVAFS